MKPNTICKHCEQQYPRALLDMPYLGQYWVYLCDLRPASPKEEFA